MIEYPRVVHLETTGRCNARCTFCPHEQSSRRYMDMDDQLFDLIIKQLRDIPIPFALVPFKLGEPLLDRKLFPRLRTIEENLPQAVIEIYTNLGYWPDNFLNDLKTLRQLQQIVVSLNLREKEEYEATMGLSFERTLNHIKTLVDSRIVSVSLNRVSTGNPAEDYAWVAWIAEKFPGVAYNLLYRGNWCETVPNSLPVKRGSCDKLNEISICCDGTVAFCCMDGLCEYQIGDVKKEHLLEIYNKPDRIILRRQLSLANIEPCKTCTFGR